MRRRPPSPSDVASKSIQGLTELVVALEGRVERVLSRNRYFGVLVLLLTVVFFARFASIALSVPTVGPDYGHYLIAANWYAGADRSGEGPFDPPFVPMLVLALAPLVGRIPALQILGAAALVSLFPAAVYFMSKFVPRWAALLGSAVFVQWQTFVEFITFGGVTNLFGIAFSLVLFRLLYETLDEPVRGWRPRRKDVVASAVLFLIVSTHHFTALLVGATLLVWISFHLLLRTRDRHASGWTAIRVVALGALPSLLYVPYLLSLVAADIGGGFGQPTPLGALSFAIVYPWRVTTEVWIAFLILALLAVTRFGPSSPLLPVVSALSLTPLVLEMTILASHPVRTLFFLEFPLVFLALVWSVRGAPAKSFGLRSGTPHALGEAICVGVFVVALLVLPSSGAALQIEGMSYSHQFMTVQTLQAFDWIARNTPPTSVFAVDAIESPAFNDRWMGMATGWWLEGYADRKAIYEANPPLLSSLPKWEDARDANRLFAGDTIFEDGLLRVADGFPFDDGAAPKVYTGYFQDYREFVGFAVPRLVNTSTGQAFTLVLGADPNFGRGLEGGVGWVTGNYSGPGFTGSRSTLYSHQNETVTLELTLSFNPNAAWNAVEMTIRLPSWTLVDLGSMGQGVIGCRVPDMFGYQTQVGRITFATTNLSVSSQVSQLGTPGEGGIGLRWNSEGSFMKLDATVALTQLSSLGTAPHPPFMRTSTQILADHSIGFLFITAQSASNIQRFDRQAVRFSRVFTNSAAVVFRVG